MFGKKKEKEIGREEEKELAEPKAKPAAAAAAAAAADVILEAMIDGVAVVVGNGNVIQANEAFSKMFGFKSPDEPIGMHFTEFLSERSVASAVEGFKKALVTGFGVNEEYTVKDVNGREFPVLLNGSVLKNENGELVGVIIVLRDITELKRAQEKEREAEAAAAEERAAVIDAMPDSLVVLNLDGEIISVNPAHLKMFGHKSADEVVGKGFEGVRERFSDPEKDIPRFLGLFKEVIEKGHTEKPIELTLRKVDGKEFFVSASGNLLRDAKGNPKNVVAVVRDITELKKKTEELEERYKELEKFSDAAVDRELKMIELKKEIEKLKSQLGKKG